MNKESILPLIEKIIIPSILGIATVLVSLLGFQLDKNRHNFELMRQKYDSTRTIRSDQSDSAQAARKFQFQLVEKYLDLLKTKDPSISRNGLEILNLMDTTFRSKIINVTRADSIDKNGEPSFTEKDKKIIATQSSYLLENLTVKIYYKSANLDIQANFIDSLLKYKHAKVNKKLDNDRLKRIETNQIVYENEQQINSCEAIRNLLDKENLKNFRIRPSSTSSSDSYVKIYLVK